MSVLALREVLRAHRLVRKDGLLAKGLEQHLRGRLQGSLHLYLASRVLQLLTRYGVIAKVQSFQLLSVHLTEVRGRRDSSLLIVKGARVVRSR